VKLYMNDEDSSENCAAPRTENRKHGGTAGIPSGPVIVKPGFEEISPKPVSG
jgi:hypothetical protein